MSVNKTLWALAMSIAVLFAAAGQSHAFRNLKESEPVPGFKIKDTKGTEVALDSYKGKFVIVTFFRADQDKSRETLTDLEKIYEKYKDKGVEVIALTPDKNDGRSIAAVVDDLKLTYPVLEDEGRAVYGAWGVFLFPTTGIIDKEGKLYKQIPSHNRQFADDLDGYVRFLLGEITAEELDGILNPKPNERFTPEQKKAERHMMLGQRMIDRKLLDKAAEELKSAVEADPTLVEAHVKYGFVLLKLGNAAEAKPQFEKALELNKRAEDAEAGLGACQVAMGDVDKGIETLEDALKLNPKPARVHYELSKAYKIKGMPDKAAEHCQKALEELGGALW
jgi:peroxiredoxin